MPFLDKDPAKALVARLRKADVKRTKRVILQRLAKKKKEEENLKNDEPTGPIYIKEEPKEGTIAAKYPPCWFENK